MRPSPPKALGPVTVSRRYAAVAGLCPAPRWGSAPDPAGANAPEPPIPSPSYMHGVDPPSTSRDQFSLKNQGLCATNKQTQDFESFFPSTSLVPTAVESVSRPCDRVRLCVREIACACPLRSPGVMSNCLKESLMSVVVGICVCVCLRCLQGAGVGRVNKRFHSALQPRSRQWQRRRRHGHGGCCYSGRWAGERGL